MALPRCFGVMETEGLVFGWKSRSWRRNSDQTAFEVLGGE